MPRSRCARAPGELELVCSGGDLGVLIGKHGQTIDSIQYLANAIVHRSFGEEAPSVVLDAAGYRARRAVVLHQIAEQAVEQAQATGKPVELEPMTAVERKVVHEQLKELGAVSASEGAEPNRFVVVTAELIRGSSAWFRGAARDAGADRAEGRRRPPGASSSRTR